MTAGYSREQAFALSGLEELNPGTMPPSGELMRHAFGVEGSDVFGEESVFDGAGADFEGVFTAFWGGVYAILVESEEVLVFFGIEDFLFFFGGDVHSYVVEEDG